MKFICKKCGSTDYKIIEKSNGSGIATGLYCAKCGQWQKWLNKQEKALFADDINDNRVADEDNEIARLKAENAELKARLEKAVELPCKVGDTVWFFDYDNTLKEGKISMLQCKADGKWKMRISYELTTRCKPVFDDYCNEIGKNYFTDRTKAEQRLAELQKEE